jgi:hypothetical protein
MMNINLTEEATRAWKKKGPSDKRLQEMLNGFCSRANATSTETRWLAAYVLEMAGHNLINCPTKKELADANRKQGKS